MPGRELIVEWNGSEMTKLFQFLELKAPVDIDVVAGRSGEIQGTYDEITRVVTINIGQHLYERSPLPWVIKELRKTVLHELRHVHQYDHWNPERLAKGNLMPYPLREIEIDAREFEKEQCGKWKLFTIKTRSFHKALP
jgi:hypothetical protein